MEGSILLCFPTLPQVNMLNKTHPVNHFDRLVNPTESQENAGTAVSWASIYSTEQLLVFVLDRNKFPEIDEIYFTAFRAELSRRLKRMNIISDDLPPPFRN